MSSTENSIPELNRKHYYVNATTKSNLIVNTGVAIWSPLRVLKGVKLQVALLSDVLLSINHFCLDNKPIDQQMLWNFSIIDFQSLTNVSSPSS